MVLMKDSLLGKIQNRSCVVAAIGLGYVGLPVALRFADAGFKVIGLDVDLFCVLNTTEAISSHLRRGQMVSLESTTYPGTTEEELLPILSRSGLKVGEDFFLIYSPERENPGYNEYSPKDIPKVEGGVTPACLEIGNTLYNTTVKTVISEPPLTIYFVNKLYDYSGPHEDCRPWKDPGIIDYRTSKVYNW